MTRIGPYDKEAMTLFDYRTDHFDDKDSITQTKAEKAPTFSKLLYILCYGCLVG
jgi:hypothetical protein